MRQTAALAGLCGVLGDPGRSGQTLLRQTKAATVKLSRSSVEGVGCFELRRRADRISSRRRLAGEGGLVGNTLEIEGVDSSKGGPRVYCRPGAGVGGGERETESDELVGERLATPEAQPKPGGNSGGPHRRCLCPYPALAGCGRVSRCGSVRGWGERSARRSERRERDDYRRAECAREAETSSTEHAGARPETFGDCRW